MPSTRWVSDIIEADDATIEIEATAELPDNSTDFPFSRVDFYVEVTVMVVTIREDRQTLTTNSGLSERWLVTEATVKTLDPMVVFGPMRQRLMRLTSSLLSVIDDYATGEYDRG